MDDRKQQLRGSPARDAFKWWHKQPPMRRDFFSCDIDFMFVDKKPIPGIIAALDYKQPGDRISFTETIAYNQLLEWGLDVYIVTAKWHGENAPEQFTSFAIQKYLGGNWRPNPPACELETIGSEMTVNEFVAWELSVRNNWKKAHAQRRQS